MNRPRPQQRRRGAIAPMTAILLIPLLAMLAFAIDMGWITHTHNELQAAADSAALAGAAQLADDFVNYHLPGLSDDKKASILATASSKAKTYATTYAGHNAAGGVSSLRLLDADIELGFTDAAGKYTALPSYTGYPNTVKVILRRDSSANAPLNLFFARVLGVNNVDLTATATASLYAANIDGFNTTSSFKSRILPMTYDVNDWDSFVNNQYQGKNWMNVDQDANDLPRLSIYTTLSDRGNFGELSLDQGNDGASVIKDWIRNGVSGNDLQAEYTKGLLPLSKHDPNSAPDWKGNPGLKNSTIQEVGDHVGEIYLMPLYKPVNDGSTTATGGSSGNGNGHQNIISISNSHGFFFGNGNGNGNGNSGSSGSGSSGNDSGNGDGNGGNPSSGTNASSTYQAGEGQGSNYYYTIVRFVAVRISAVDSTGSDKAIKVQPTALIDPNALYSGTSVAPAAPPSNSTTITTTFVGAKLVK